jgi:hypothetical protein
MDTVSEKVFENALDKIRKLAKANAVLLKVLRNMLQIHAADMEEAGFSPPICECELCTDATEAIRKAKE